MDDKESTYEATSKYQKMVREGKGREGRDVDGCGRWLFMKLNDVVHDCRVCNLWEMVGSSLKLSGHGVIFGSSNVKFFADVGTCCPFGETFRIND